MITPEQRAEFYKNHPGLQDNLTDEAIELLTAYFKKHDVGTKAKNPYKSVTFDAVIIRKDGTREDLGTVAYWHRNPFLRMLYNFKRWKDSRYKVSSVATGPSVTL